MQALPSTPLADYVIALAEKIGGENITHATRLSNGRICLYLKNEDVLNTFMMEHGGIVVNDKYVIANRMSQKVERLVISNIPPEFPASDLTEILSQMGRVVSPVTPLSLGLKRPDLSHIQCWRRQCFIVRRDGLPVPESVLVTSTFMDMTGAFDRVWWPGVLHRLHVKGISGEMYKVIKDYLKGRWVQLEEGNWVNGKRVNRGCPQGSVLGPQLWKIVFDELIEMMEERHGKSIEMIAYADDGVILIGANSRREIEEKANLVIKDLMEWCKMAKMELSKEKTVGMMLKGKLDSGRLPRVFLEERKICI
ncbi:hypothetical protein J437_LFUL008966, partial [Ladona fulva]